MASQTSQRKAIPLAEFVADIERRRVEANLPDVPRNAGTRRTPSKRALLAAIARTNNSW